MTRIVKNPPAKFREYAGVLTAFLVVMSYVGIGYATSIYQGLFGTPLQLPDDWSAAMLSLSSAALGYLIGKNMDSSSNSQVTYELNDPRDVEVIVEAPPSEKIPTKPI